jgi:hypothetical protein
MKTAFIILLAFLLAPLVNTAQSNSEKWVFEKEKNNVKIWTRKTDASEFKSLRAIATYRASVKQMAAVLNDAASYPEWMADLESTEILKEVNPNERYYYFVFDAPWPISNRDNIVHFTLAEDIKTGGFKATVEGIAGYLPEKTGIVRILKSKGSWQVRPKGKGEIELIFEYTADPGGKIPVWTVNMFIVDGPIKTLGNLREFIKREKYQQ